MTIDTLPLQLDTKLRINRQDATLPDKNGYIWRQACVAIKHDPSILQGNHESIVRRLTKILDLGSMPQFPTARMVTIRRSSVWGKLADDWCNTRLGRDTFHLSSWSWMLTSRLHQVRPPDYSSFAVAN